MKQKILLLSVVIFISLGNSNLFSQNSGDIAWLGNNLRADSLYFDLLKGAGYNVVDKTATKGDLTAQQIADLDTFDLVILSRSLNSGDYNYPLKYNAIKSPVLCMANMAARNSRWRMFPAPASNDPTTLQDVIAVLDLTHPIFNNLSLSDTNTIDVANPGIVIKPLLDMKSAGKGKLIGVTAKDSLVMIAEWDELIPYFEGSIDTVHGKRMVFFNTQGSNITAPPFTANLSANGNKLLLNITEYMITGTVALVNQAPTEILLSNISIAENTVAPAEVGILTAVDANIDDSWIFSLVAGDGDNDNSKFSIVDNKLTATEVFDFESNTQFSVRISVADTAGLTFESAFIINVTNVNEAPESLSLSNVVIDEEQPAGTMVGTLSATDPDAGNVFTYSLVAGDGSNDADNNMFAIAGSDLKTAAVLDFETKQVYAVNIMVSDGELSYTKAFSVTVNDIIGTGLNQNAATRISVFPNPFADVLNIQSTNESKAIVSVYDVTGQVVFKKSITLSDQLQLKLQLPKGLYVLNIKGADIQFITKVICK